MKKCIDEKILLPHALLFLIIKFIHFNIDFIFRDLLSRCAAKNTSQANHLNVGDCSDLHCCYYCIQVEETFFITQAFFKCWSLFFVNVFIFI